MSCINGLTDQNKQTAECHPGYKGCQTGECTIYVTNDRTNVIFTSNVQDFKASLEKKKMKNLIAGELLSGKETA